MSKHKKKSKKGQKIVKKVMHKYKHRTLHSSSKKGPVVKDKDQAIAIALESKRKKTHSCKAIVYVDEATFEKALKEEYVY